jgi:FtsP/CotA-like multicopper oxidase with cupredoxin domain
MEPVTRREFVRGGALAGAAIILLPGAPVARAMGGGGMGGGGMGGGGMGGGVSVIDPPVGSALRLPALIANASTDSAIVEVSLEARQAPIVVNGRTASLLTYNGQFPGPMIRARRDQLLRVHFSNGLPDDMQTNFLGHSTRVTNLHTHGLHVSPGDNANKTHSDNMMIMSMPGESAEYEYDLSKHPGGNLNFYHPHIHGSVTDQMWGGMSGPLIIEDEVTALAPYAEKVLVLKDITLAGSVPAPHDSQMDYMHGVEGDIVMVNGQVNPRLAIAPGQVQRWRVVNACTARFFRLSLQSHTMYLVGTDGGLLDKPYPISEILLAPGERIDVLVRANLKSGSYKWLSLPYSRGGMSAQQQVTLMTLTYGGAKQNQQIPNVVDPSAHRETMGLSMVSARKRMTLTMAMGAVGIDGRTYVAHDNCYSTSSTTGTWEIWEVVNSSGMDHPFHHHTNSAQVLSITGGDAGYANLYTSAPAWKDVTIVPKMGKIELLMPVRDYAGMAMIHCHIIEHEDIGMMGVWDIMDGVMD